MGEQKLRAGIIGLGVGRSHAKGYLSSPNADLIAVCDNNEARLQQLAGDWNTLVRYTDYKQMLAETPLDVVSICLPNALHADATIAALEAGMHVIVEKPMAPTVAESLKMLQAAKQNGRRLMVAYNWRYRPDTQWMYHMVQNGKLGTIFHANLSWRRETGIPGSGWFGVKDLAGGGALIDLGVHVIDMSLWMMGFPAVKTVSGDTRMIFGPQGRKVWGRYAGEERGTSFDVEDGATGFVRLSNGVSMFIHITWAEHTQPQEDALRIELQGTEGTAIFHMRNYRNEDTLRFYTEMEGEPVSVIPSPRFGGPQGHEALIHDLLKAVQQGKPSPTDGSQGLISIRILESLYESARCGHEIAVGED